MAMMDQHAALDDILHHCITTYPCFQSLTPTQVNELVALMQQVNYQPQQYIVRENELIDSIYIIVTGKAEVSKLQIYKKKSLQVPVAVLRAGEAIGLNDTGFYSTTGKRTATVIALTDMVLFKLDIKDLYTFLHKNNLELSMSRASLQMLRMRFIKQSLPFAKLTPERLQWLAERVEVLSVAAGTLLFKEGDAGDKCYFVYEGKIEIFIMEENRERQLALLKPPVLFGEATFITDSPRNASARALEDSQLLQLSYTHLSELVESENSVASMFMTLTIDRSRPNKISNVIEHERQTADGQSSMILKNVDNGKYFKLSKEGAYIWQQLDGTHTLQDLTLDLAEQYNVFAPDMVAALIAKLTKYGFISNIEIYDSPQHGKVPWWKKAATKLKRSLDFRYAFGDADNFITRIYHKYIHYLFTKSAQIVLLSFIVLGFIAFVTSIPDILYFFSTHRLRLLLLLGLIPLSLAVTVLHELGHAFAVKACGREVHYIGIGWSWLTPIAFTDTSDMWLANRKSRMFVNIAGVYVDALVAGFSALLIYVFPYPYIQCMLWLFALYIYIRAVRMLSPLQEMDGYYILMDWVEKPRLRQSAVMWLVKTLPQCLRKPRLFKIYMPEIFYWLACLTFLTLITLLTLLVQSFVLDVLGLQTNRYVVLILPFLVIIFSSLGVIVEIKNRVEE